MSEQKLLRMAVEMALKAHGDQLDKGGMPYFLHPFHVMDWMETYEEKTLAVLHDVVEDCDVEFFCYPNGTSTIECGFLSLHLPVSITNGLVTITKREKESKEAYWFRVKSNPLALRVKLADIGHNSSERRLAALPPDEQAYLRNKYRVARAFLAKDDGLVPVLVNKRFKDAWDIMVQAGWESNTAWRMIMDCQMLETDFDGVLRYKNG